MHLKISLRKRILDFYDSLLDLIAYYTTIISKYFSESLENIDMYDIFFVLYDYVNTLQYYIKFLRKHDINTMNKTILLICLFTLNTITKPNNQSPISLDNQAVEEPVKYLGFEELPEGSKIKKICAQKKGDRYDCALIRRFLYCAQKSYQPADKFEARSLKYACSQNLETISDIDKLYFYYGFDFSPEEAVYEMALVLKTIDRLEEQARAKNNDAILENILTQLAQQP